MHLMYKEPILSDGQKVDALVRAYNREECCSAAFPPRPCRCSNSLFFTDYTFSSCCFLCEGSLILKSVLNFHSF